MLGVPNRHDHTADIRALIRQMAIRGISGLVMTALGAGGTRVIGSAFDGSPPPALMRAIWILWSVLGTVSLLHLALALIFWLIYVLRRRHLDAARAEVIGEMKARMANDRGTDQA
ncbi:hypothetical protein [Actinoplanes sp. NPDC026619]|uniref:hypothetical protein n=1 Tax=Actinoplanes sp. NPDC026619 TaxID=3155798 RepID=UPI0033F06C0C